MPFMHKFIKPQAQHSTALNISIYLITNGIKYNILFLLPRISFGSDAMLRYVFACFSAVEIFLRGCKKFRV